jgi:hypothetical protein
MESKKGVSEMVSYVILISITVTLAVIVFMWLKDYGNIVAPKIDCDEGTSMIITGYRCSAGVIYLEVKNNGMFSIDGFMLYFSNNSKREATELLYPHPSTGYPLGHHFFRRSTEQVTKIPEPVSRWAFEENLDDSKTENEAELCGINAALCEIIPNYTYGIIGKALNFNGSIFVNVSEDQNLDFTNQFSIAAWFKTANNNQFLVVKENTGAYPYVLDMSGGKLQCYGTPDGITEIGIKNPAASPLNDGEWHYAVCIFNGTTWTIYSDLNLYAQGHDPGTLINTDDGIRIGYGFQGLIEEISLYKRPLTQEEMKSSYYNAKKLNPGEIRENIQFLMRTNQDIEILQLQPFIWDDKIQKGEKGEKIMCKDAVIKQEITCPFNAA